MKKLMMILMMIAPMVTSCGSDDNSSDVPTFDRIFGRWIETSYFSSGGYYIPIPAGDESIYHFKSNMTFTKEDQFGKTSGTFEHVMNTNTEDHFNMIDEKGKKYIFVVKYEDDNNAEFSFNSRKYKVTRL